MASTAIAESGFVVSRIRYPAGHYRHEPSGLVELRVVRAGSSYAEIDLGAGARRVFTRPGDLLLSLPHSATSFLIADVRELTVLAVDAALADRLLAQAGGTITELASAAERPMRDPMLAEMCRRLEDWPPAEPVVREWMLGVTLATLLNMARARRDRSQRPVLTQHGLDEVLAAIDAERDADTTVERLASVAGLPRRAFATAFREATGLPVHQFVLRRRVDRAITLLETSGLSLADIAQRTGFSHQAHMTRVFSRLKGRTPGQLRGGGQGRPATRPDKTHDSP
jgi:AraC family transcriptional regulator